FDHGPALTIDICCNPYHDRPPRREPAHPTHVGSPAARSTGSARRLAAPRAELRARLERRPAARTLARHLGERIDPRDVIDRAHLLGQLLRRDLRLVRRRFLGEVRRAALAQLALRVPADVRAHPLPAPRALVELRLDLVDRG